MEVNVLRWVVDVDPASTAKRHASRPPGCGCECRDCVEFLASTDRIFPDEFRQLLTSLGVDAGKPSELCHCGQDETGRSIVAGWYHLVGRLVSGADALVPTGEGGGTVDLETLVGSLEIGFTTRLAVVPDEFDGDSVLQLEFGIRY